MTQQAATATKHQPYGPATAQHKVVQEVAMQPCRRLHLLCKQQLQDQQQGPSLVLGQLLVLVQMAVA